MMRRQRMPVNATHFQLRFLLLSLRGLAVPQRRIMLTIRAARRIRR